MTRAGMAILGVAIVLAGCDTPEIQINETPIRVVDERTGYGHQIAEGDSVVVDYVITLPNGKLVLDQEDFPFKVGTDSVIRGIDEGIRGMRAGGTRIFTCPPHKHWGRAGYARGLIPPATDIIVKLTVVRVESTSRMRVGAAESRRSE